jgi:hypothetical protein
LYRGAIGFALYRPLLRQDLRTAAASRPEQIARATAYQLCIAYRA